MRVSQVWDSVDMMVGLESDGLPGLGWQADTQDTSEYPYEARVAQMIACEWCGVHVGGGGTGVVQLIACG